MRLTGRFFAALALLALALSFVYAPDPAPLQDFCVAVNDTNLGGYKYIYTYVFTIIIFHENYRWYI